MDELSDALRVHLVEPGQYALVEVPGWMTAEQCDRLRAALDEELRDRVYFVQGAHVHVVDTRSSPVLTPRQREVFEDLVRGSED